MSILELFNQYDDARKLKEREISSEIKKQIIALCSDGAKWRALLASERIRMLGSAGIDGSKDGYVHVGVELFSKYPGDCGRDNKLGIEWLNKYIDITMAYQRTKR